jgi:hypothetical protein
MARILIPAAAAYLGWLLVQWQAQWFFPHHNLGIYEGELSDHQERTIYTNTQNFVVVCAWTGALLVAVCQRDRIAWVSILLLGVGGGVGFTLAALWCLGYSFAPDLIDWWKMWELHSGFNFGLLYAALLFCTIQGIDNDLLPRGDAPTTRSRLWSESAALALAVFLIVSFMGADEFPKSGIFLGLMFAVPLLLSIRSGKEAFDLGPILEKRKAIHLTYSIFLLLFILFWGVTSRAGVLLGLYEPSAVDQYAWPPSRVALFLPFGLVVVGYTLIRYYHILRGAPSALLANPDRSRVAIRLVDLMALIGLVGAISIWPSKIGAFYALFLFFALFAFNRMNHRFDQVDRV